MKLRIREQNEVIAIREKQILKLKRNVNYTNVKETETENQLLKEQIR